MFIQQTGKMYFKGRPDKKIVSNYLISEWQFGVEHF